MQVLSIQDVTPSSTHTLSTFYQRNQDTHPIKMSHVVDRPLTVFLLVFMFSYLLIINQA